MTKLSIKPPKVIVSPKEYKGLSVDMAYRGLDITQLSPCPSTLSLHLKQMKKQRSDNLEQQVFIFPPQDEKSEKVHLEPPVMATRQISPQPSATKYWLNTWYKAIKKMIGK